VKIENKMRLEQKLNKMHEISDKINSLKRGEFLTKKEFEFWNDNIDKTKSELEEEYNYWKHELKLDNSFINKRI
jgi:hypothetical protein